MSGHCGYHRQKMHQLFTNRRTIPGSWLRRRRTQRTSHAQITQIVEGLYEDSVTMKIDASASIILAVLSAHIVLRTDILQTVSFRATRLLIAVAMADAHGLMLRVCASMDGLGQIATCTTRILPIKPDNHHNLASHLQRKSAALTYGPTQHLPSSFLSVHRHFYPP